ncbi:unnamed protein product [Allacma fusca]|uniref:Rho-GAP domain-containing protein n=1 Tax=Allacma fusca TaxID=39272 RepID=A0A8J2L793_9HEXA|nr:unnamed protein product [Allacma fusca]
MLWEFPVILLWRKVTSFGGRGKIGWDTMDTAENGSEDDQGKKELQRGSSALSRKESSRRKPFKVERLDIEELYYPDEDENLIPKKHVLESLEFDQVTLQSVVTAELRDLGISIESNGRQSRSKSRKPAPVQAIQPDQFLETVEVILENGNLVRLCVPHVVKQTCEFIRKYITVEGIFRKSGLSSRVQSLKQRFSEKDTDIFNPDDTVFDASSVLKQYLRELPNPLIPADIQPMFLKCLDHQDERTRIDSILMCIYLLPVSNIHILAYLMKFLFDVVKHSNANKMGYKNLALVLTPNIMPVEEKKSLQKGKDSIQSEKLALEKNRRAMEILILYGDYVGWVSSKLYKAIEVQSLYKSSDDELENDRGRDGRRKKRRSGSLTRMFGFLRKVTNGKGGETPCSTTDTPNDFGLHTPVLKASTKKRANEEQIFSTQKKKTILDAVRRNGLHGGDPNSPVGFLACPSPAVCFDPSPMRTEWKNLNCQLNLATPNIMRDKTQKRSKSTPDNARVQWSSNSKSSSKHNKLGFGRKSGKKVEFLTDSDSDTFEFLFDESANKSNPILNLPKYFRNFSLLPSKNLKSSVSATPDCSKVKGMFKKKSKPLSYPLMPNCPDNALLHQQVNQNLQKTDITASVVSIHSLQDSPRKKPSRHSSATRLNDDRNQDLRPCDEIPPPPEFSDSCVPSRNPSKEKPATEESMRNDSGDGEYVMISATATTDDVKNEAFIASSNSLDLTDSTSNDTLSHEARITPGDDEKFMPVELLRLTPLIREINNLTMFAQQDIVTEKEGAVDTSVGSPIPTLETSSDPDPPSPPIIPPRNSIALTEVAKEFQRTLQEEKIIKLRSEMNSGGASRSAVAQRRGSVHEKGVSPSQRKINSFRRRRSHDSAKSTTPAAHSPRFMSLRSPRSRPVPPPLTRSPTRCTLRRGRPNTAWAGLARPSPCRSNASVNGESGRTPRVRILRGTGTTPRDKVVLKDKGNISSPVMRRMSSVQELVHKLESKAKIQTTKSASEIVPEKALIRRPTDSNKCNEDSANPCDSNLQQSEPPTRSPVKKSPRVTNNTPNQGNEWVSGANFEFDESLETNEKSSFGNNGNRESIHFLKTRNAGKVSASVRMFDGMGKKLKSPGNAGKSMIPRYTALHTIPSRTQLTNP